MEKNVHARNEPLVVYWNQRDRIFFNIISVMSNRFHLISMGFFVKQYEKELYIYRFRIILSGVSRQVEDVSGHFAQNCLACPWYIGA